MSALSLDFKRHCTFLLTFRCLCYRHKSREEGEKVAEPCPDCAATSVQDQLAAGGPHTELNKCSLLCTASLWGDLLRSDKAHSDKGRESNIQVNQSWEGRLASA